MVFLIRDKLGRRAVEILRDVYVHNIPKAEILVIRNVPVEEYDFIFQKISHDLMYHVRLENHNVMHDLILFDEEVLRKVVWREFVIEKIDDGMTTGEIAKELKVPLAIVNSYI